VAGLVCAVSFERYGRLHYVDPGALRPKVGDRVLVPTAEGPEVAECVWASEWVSEDFGPLPVLEGLATDDDLARDARVRAAKAEAKLLAKRMARAAGLPMKVVAVDYVGPMAAAGDLVGPRADGRADRAVAAGGRFTVYFSAPERVDFRAVATDLGRSLRAKVELRQVGARDEAKAQGGIGPCGRELCCATFLKDFEPVSIRMAKDQDLPINPLKISGACGRLMCCLKYEHPLYREFKADAPPIGSTVDTPEGEGRVVGYSVPADQVVVRLAASGARCACAKASVCGPRRAYENRRSDG
jgi:cell fate regulator YaaT (PSP1 superfamily)